MSFYKANTEEEKEFVELYNKWYNSFCFSAHGSADPNAKVSYKALINWCKEHHDEALKYIRDILLQEPNEIVRILDDLYKEEYKLNIEGYCPLDIYCNLWLNVTDPNFKDTKKKIKIIDYYKDYNKWKKHLEKTYISWRPNLEDDPNVTFEEFKQGKRNNYKKYNHKWHNFSLSILSDKELTNLYNNGHLGDMTKYIKELNFFYNRVKEEIKRRELKNGGLYY